MTARSSPERPELTQAHLKESFHYDPETGLFTRVAAGRYRIRSIAGTKANTGYRQIMIDYRWHSEHRLAWLYMTGEWPRDQIDHCNLDKIDNRWCNLREASPSQNKANTVPQANNTSGFKGVSWVTFSSGRRKCVACIRVNKKRVALGFFDTAEAASTAYQKAAQEHFGKFARVS